MGVFKKIADYTGATHGVDPTGHSHSTDGWFTTAISNLSSLISGKADAVHTHTKSQITDFAHTHSISEVTGLQTALDGKLDSEVTEMSATFANPIVVDDLPVGKLVLIDNSSTPLRTQLSLLIVAGAYVFDQLHFHLNSGDLTNNFFLVRRFTWTGGTPIFRHNFIEVVGAWN